MSRRRRARVLIREAWPYRDALAWMEQTWADVVAGGEMQMAVGSHDAEVITLGRHAPEDEILDPEGLAARGARIERIDRGGGATAHGPGQIVLYPVVDLRALGLSIPAFTDLLEAVALDLLRDHDLEGRRLPGLPGIYVEERKVASLGFRSRRGVVTHGLAVNVQNDVELFSYIAPCGEVARPVTSVGLERREDAHHAPGGEGGTPGAPVDLRRDMDRLVRHFCDRAVIECVS